MIFKDGHTLAMIMYRTQVCVAGFTISYASQLLHDSRARMRVCSILAQSRDASLSISNYHVLETSRM